MEVVEEQKKHNWLKKALRYYQLQQYDNVLLACDQAIKIDATFDRAHLGKGLAFYQLRQFKKALSSVEDAIKYNPKNVQAYVAKGNIYYENDWVQKARTAYNQALKLEPHNQQATLGKEKASKVLDYLLHPEKSMEHEDTIDIQERVQRIRQRTNEKLAKMPRRTNIETISDHTKQTDQNLAHELAQEAIKFFEEERYDEALEAFNKLAELGPLDMQMTFKKGVTLKHLGRQKEADECFLQVEKLRTYKLSRFKTFKYY